MRYLTTLLTCLLILPAWALDYPETCQENTTDTYHNVGVADSHHKLTAALQYEDTSVKPILLRTSGNTGHGSGTPLNEAISQQVDRLVFFSTDWV
ncbi:MAG: hypothetical protein GY732_18720 [Gammaproteobacteria bacterium]|nr:hypothetical protein [Gammaproteobacteria bacterium]